MESLILAQNERWRRVLSMQVGRQGNYVMKVATATLGDELAAH